MIGMKFGRLTVLSELPKIKYQNRKYKCICECGKNTYAEKCRLISGHKKSCGCLIAIKIREARLTHGMAGNKTYRSWSAMLDRCRRKKSSIYYKYGAKGIKVCERWNKFENFLADMGEKPDGTTIDRIDGSKGYYPENCRWATAIEQGQNRKRTRIFNFNGMSGSIRYFSEKLKYPLSTLQLRINRGWDLADAFTRPYNQKYKSV